MWLNTAIIFGMGSLEWRFLDRKLRHPYWKDTCCMASSMWVDMQLEQGDFMHRLWKYRCLGELVQQQWEKHWGHLFVVYFTSSKEHVIKSTYVKVRGTISSALNEGHKTWMQCGILSFSPHPKSQFCSIELNTWAYT